MPSASSRDPEMYTHIDEMQIAMAYVPCQKFSTTYDLGYALNVGQFSLICANHFAESEVADDDVSESVHPKRKTPSADQ